MCAFDPLTDGVCLISSTRRLIRQLSAVINFIRFREGKEHMYQEAMAKKQTTRERARVAQVSIGFSAYSVINLCFRGSSGGFTFTNRVLVGMRVHRALAVLLVESVACGFRRHVTFT